jgi:hypothetical protein
MNYFSLLFIRVHSRRLADFLSLIPYPLFPCIRSSSFFCGTNPPIFLPDQGIWQVTPQSDMHPRGNSLSLKTFQGIIERLRRKGDAQYLLK